MLKINNWILLVSFLFLITSCATIKELEVVNGGEFLKGWDFREYQKNGFLFTPEKYSHKYDSVGLLELEVVPHAFYDYTEKYISKIDIKLAKQKIFQIKLNDKTYQVRTKNIFEKNKVWFIEVINPKNVVKKIYTQAIAMGANALINFKVTQDTNPYYSGYSNPVYLTSYIVSGFAIKRVSLEQ